MVSNSENASNQLNETELLSKDHWFSKMDGYVDWRVVAPQIHNPYQKPLSDQMLSSMVRNRETVKKMMKLRCLADGHEILIVESLGALRFSTSHPCLSGVSKREIRACLEQFGINKEIETEIDKVQSAARDELTRRQLMKISTSSSEKTVGQIRAEKEAEKKEKKEKLESGPGTGVRVIRR
jgi:hypothetical protein